MKEHQKKGRKKRKKIGRRSIRHWIVATTAIGVLVGFTIGRNHTLNLVYAQEKQNISSLVNEGNNESVQKFEIPPGTLGEVIKAFEKIAGWRVMWPDEKFKDLPSKGVSGNFTNEQALAQILADTGLTYGRTAPLTVTLRLLGPSETVEVVREGETLSSPKFTQPLRDTPQTITVINKKAIEEQGATTLRDVLQNVPGLTIAAGEGGTPAGDNLTLRGFSARNDIFVDGVRDLSPQSRDPFNLEQVEVVKGPTSAVSGRGSTGGTINLVSKTPSLSPFYNFSLSLGTDRTKRVTGDINLPLARLGWGDRTAFRLNVMAQNSNFAGREVVGNDRWGIAPTFSFGFGKKAFLTLDYYHLQQNNISDYGIPWVPATNNVLTAFRDRPAPVPRETFYGFLNRDKEKLRTDLATVQLDYTFNDNLNLRNQFSFGRSTRDSIATPPRFAGNDSTVINREMRSWVTEDNVLDNQTDFTARFKTGQVKHTFVTGIELTRENNIRQLRTAPNSTTTLFNPNPNDVYPGVILVNPLLGDITANSQAVYFFETASFGDKFDLTGGVRWDRFDAAGLSIPSTGAPTIQPVVAEVDQFTSFRFGAIYKPLPQGSVYASVASSFDPSLGGLSYGAVLTALDPEKTYNYEIGTKWDLLGNRILLSGAIFRVDKTNARTPGLPGEPPTVLSGKQRVDGIELGISGNITRNWNVLGAYTLLDSKILESNANLVGGVPGTSLETGKRLINTPRNSMSLWTTYQTPWRIAFGGGARFIGKRFGNTTNTRFVESYWLFDATASYQFNKYFDLRMNIFNITDQFYFDRIGGGHLVPGAGRSALFGIGFHF